MKIGKRNVGPEYPAYIVAEIGINHSGNAELARHQMELARGAGADAVKFQKRTPELCVPKEQWDEIRSTPWGEMRYIDYKRKIEFGKDEYDYIARVAREIGIDWFASVWDIPSVEFMEQYDPVAYKIPSAMLTNHELLKAVADTGRPTVLSTGMSTWIEILDAQKVFGRPRDLIVCQCTSSYPCEPEEVNLRVIPEYGLDGYSGHELGIAISIAAVALGAKYIERHFTNDRGQWGTDQSISLEPWRFAEMVDGIREVEMALGSGVKQVYESERPFMKKLRYTDASKVRETA